MPSLTDTIFAVQSSPGGHACDSGCSVLESRSHLQRRRCFALAHDLSMLYKMPNAICFSLIVGSQVDLQGHEAP